jgi:ketosteroid isomerase-like protein
MSTLEFNTEKIVGEWVKSWNTYDLNQVDRLFLQDSRLTYFSSEKEGTLIGIEAIREHHEGFGFVKGGKEQPNKLWVEDLHISTFNSTVVVTGIWFFQREDGSKQRGPVTIVYVKIKDEFRIAHMNFSNYANSNETK